MGPTQALTTGALLIGMFFAGTAGGASPRDADEFNGRIRAGFHPRKLSRRDSDREVGEDFFPVGTLVSGQPTYSFLKMEDQLREASNMAGHGGGGNLEFKHDRGRSLYPLEKSVKAIRYRGRLYVVDGHHKVLTSIYYGAQTVPVSILDDWSDLRRKEFRSRMVDRGLTYPLDEHGRPSDDFFSFSEMKDDPNLYLARMVYLKIKAEISMGEMLISVKGLEGTEAPVARPVIIKLNEDVPFLEFYAAQVLRDNGVTYKPEWGHRIPVAEIEKIRRILVRQRAAAEADSADPNGKMLGFALIVDKPVDLNRMTADEREEWLFKLVTRHFLRRRELALSCEGALRPGR